LTEKELEEVDQFRMSVNLNDEDQIQPYMAKMVEQGKFVGVVNHIITFEIQKNKFGIMREESLGANLMKYFWFSYDGKEYLKEAIYPLIKEVSSVTKSKPLDIDLKQVKDLSKVKKNLKKILKILRTWLDFFLSTYNLFPRDFEAILVHFYGLLTALEGSKKSHLGLGFSEDALRLFSGFFLLRFICPAIVLPQKFGVSQDLSTSTQRTLIIISKILQTAGNQVELTTEEHMKEANEFVEATIPDLLAFVSNLMDTERDRNAKVSPKLSAQEKLKMAKKQKEEIAKLNT